MTLSPFCLLLVSVFQLAGFLSCPLRFILIIYLLLNRQDQQEQTSVEHDGTDTCADVDEENESFLGLDDVPGKTNACD